MALFSSQTQIGVSIGTSSIKIAELKKSGKSYSLVHFGIAQLPDEAILNREIVNHMAVVDALKGLVHQLKIKGRSVTSSISGSAVIVKKILLDPVPSRELDDAILWEAEQYVPYDMSEVSFDYEIVNKNGPEGKMEILLVACKKAIVESYVAVLKDAGLEVSSITVDLFSLQNTYEINYPQEAAVVLVDIGASSLKLSISQNGQAIFSKDSVMGGKTLTTEIQRHLNLSFHEAEVLKIDGNAQGQVPQEVSDLMHVMSENFTSEIKRSIDFFIASNAGTQPAYILLTGGSSRLPNLPKMIEEACLLPTQQMNSFAKINYDQNIFNDEYIQSIITVAPIPIGLALQGFIE